MCDMPSIAVHLRGLQHAWICAAVCVVVRCSMLQCVAVCCSMLHCVAVCCSMYQYVAEVSMSPTVCGAVHVAVCCSALQY